MRVSETKRKRKMKSQRNQYCDECETLYDIDEGEAEPVNYREEGREKVYWVCPECKHRLYPVDLPDMARLPRSTKGTVEITITALNKTISRREMELALKQNTAHFVNATAGVLESGLEYDATVHAEKEWEDGLIYFLDHEAIWKISRRNLRELLENKRDGSSITLSDYEAVRVCDSYWFDYNKLTSDSIKVAIEDLGGTT